MTLMSDLPRDLVGEILSRVPITCLRAVRSTCKQWNALSKKRIFGKVEAKQQFLGFAMMGFKVCSVGFDLRGIHNDEEEFFDPSIKQTGKFSQVEISKVFHCGGLVLCVTRDNTRVVVWNPYLGQTRWIEPKTAYHGSDRYALLSDRYALGYDNNNARNHKILRFLNRYSYSVNHIIVEYEIYDLNSNSWKVLEVSPLWDLNIYQDVSLKGNSYMIVERDDDVDFYKPSFLLSFDFTRESFGQLLDMPFQVGFLWHLSSLRDEKLAVLQENGHTIDIWVTNKIEPNAVSWSNFLKFNMASLNGIPLMIEDQPGSFFIDEEKKIAVVFDFRESEMTRYNAACIIGENGFLKKVNFGGTVNRQESRNFREPPRYFSLVCSTSYVPSLVQIDQIAGGKRKEKKRKEKKKKRLLQ